MDKNNGKKKQKQKRSQFVARKKTNFSRTYHGFQVLLFFSFVSVLLYIGKFFVVLGIKRLIHRLVFRQYLDFLFYRLILFSTFLFFFTFSNKTNCFLHLDVVESKFIKTFV